MPDNPHLEIAIKQIEFARKYNLGLIADIADSDWFRMPTPGVTHVAWQVAHLAMAEYGLCLFRMRGRREEDIDLMSSDFRKKFSKGTVPNPDPAQNPTPAEIRQVLSRVHERAMTELAGYTDADLDTPVDEPHAVFNTKIGAIFFCSVHEMMHAGQIGLMRRLLGKSPIR
jgi:hypothetical protein